MSEAPLSVPGTPRPSRRRRAIRWGFGLLASGFAVAAVVAAREQIRLALDRLPASYLALALLLVVAGLLANVLSWRAVVAGLGSRLTVRSAGRVFLLGQIGKYVPGSLWSVVGQVELGRDHGVPRSRSGVAALLAILVGLLTGTLVAVAGLLGSAAGDLGPYAWLLVVLPLGFVALHPRVLGWLSALVVRVTGRPSVAFEIAPSVLLRAAAWSLVMWLCFGGQIWLLAYGVGARGGDLFLLSTGGYAAAWVVGFLVVIAPAGAGARELALVFALRSVLPAADALTVALVSRALMLVGDLLCVLAAVLVSQVAAHTRGS